jgi:hypothetical protein
MGPGFDTRENYIYIYIYIYYFYKHIQNVPQKVTIYFRFYADLSSSKRCLWWVTLSGIEPFVFIYFSLTDGNYNHKHTLQQRNLHSCSYWTYTKCKPVALNAVFLVQCHIGSRRIHGGRTDSMVGFLRLLRFSQTNLHSTNCSTSINHIIDAVPYVLDTDHLNKQYSNTLWGTIQIKGSDL